MAAAVSQLLLLLLAVAHARYITEERLAGAFPATPAVSLLELEPVAAAAPVETQAPTLPICGLGKDFQRGLHPVDAVPDNGIAACRKFPGLHTLLRHYSRASLAGLSDEQLKTLLLRARTPQPPSGPRWQRAKAPIQRECPRAHCPVNITCADKDAHCCRGGTMCCPADSTCLNTDPPMCLRENATDPNRCLNQECKVGKDCPYANVGACCLGGETCCPNNAACTEDGKCRVMSRIEFLFKRQLDPVETKPIEMFSDVEIPPPTEKEQPPVPVRVVKVHHGKPTAPPKLPTAENYDPVSVVPALLEEFQGVPADMVKNKAAPAVSDIASMKDALGGPIGVTTELFHSPPKKEGERDRNATTVIGNRRFRVHEHQSSKVVNGKLRTVTTHKLVVDDPKDGMSDDEFKLRVAHAPAKVSSIEDAIPLYIPQPHPLPVVQPPPPAKTADKE